MGGRLSCASDRYAEKDPDRQPYTKKPAQFKNYVSGEYIFFLYSKMSIHVCVLFFKLTSL